MMRLAMICLSLFYFISPVQSQENIRDLQPWQGEFASRALVLDSPEAKEFFRATARVAEAGGKNCTPQRAKEELTRVFHTDFHRIQVRNNTIVYFFPGSDQGLALTYEYQGKFMDTFQGKEFAWHAFRAQGSKGPYSHILVLPMNTQAGAAPHFHLRYAMDDFSTLTHEAGKGMWWPVLSRENSIQALLSELSAQQMAGLL